ncbi:MAG: hypothetical protein HWE08_09595 [Alphaproteobacteria bacterium]|nr:hypothetical protein [Alphaproteobacteria bacterium]
MRIFLHRTFVAGTLAACTAFTSGASAMDTHRLPADLGASKSASLGFYVTIPFGGTQKTDWRKEMEYSFAYRLDHSRGGFASQAGKSISVDVAALRFNDKGFDRFSLSGADFYLVDGRISLNADGEDEKSGMGWGTKIAIAGGGLLVLTALSMRAAGKQVGEALGCAIVNTAGGDCDD